MNNKDVAENIQKNIQNLFGESSYGSTPYGVSTAQAFGSLDISSIPVGAEIYINGSDTGFTTPHVITGLAQGPYTYKLTHIDYYDTLVTPFNILSGQTTTINVIMSPLPCPVSIKGLGDSLILKATPVQGVAPYTIEFRRSNPESMADSIDTSNVDTETYLISTGRLGGSSNPVIGSAEGVQISRTYTIDTGDIGDATSKALGEGASLLFGSKMIDSCAPEQICVAYCKIFVVCPAPTCDFTVT